MTTAADQMVLVRSLRGRQFRIDLMYFVLVLEVYIVDVMLGWSANSLFLCYHRNRFFAAIIE